MIRYRKGKIVPIKAKEMEKIIVKDGWRLKGQRGSHRQYVHPTKPGRVTIPFHTTDLTKAVETSILKQAGLKSFEK